MKRKRHHNFKGGMDIPSVVFGPAVLVLEDDPILRLMAMDFMEEAGFEVLDAAHADEAIVVLEHRKDIRVVLTDIHMPRSMDGIKLAAYIRGRWPPIELIVTSGPSSTFEG